jgi:AraC-like DNA-binding protein
MAAMRSETPRAIEHVSHESELGCWQMWRTRPHRALRPYVREYVGWFEQTPAPICRRELPTEVAPVMINFGAPVRIFDPADERRWTDYGSFATGAYDSHVLVGSTGPSAGIQINFTIMGARLFLARPLGDLTNRVIALDDLVGPLAGRLTAALYDAPTWHARFDMLDTEIAARLLSAREPARAVMWAWRRLMQSGGTVGIGTLVDEVRWSQRHLIARFREETGLAPKALGRVLRFGRAVALLRNSPAPRLADIAHACGYYDQAHFTRDFHAFAGVTATELLRSAIPDGGGYLGDR